jgi:ABC-2 type transport system ATP-binding protein
MLQQMASRGKTILLCSHILAVVEKLCDRVLLLHQGRLTANEPTQQLIKKSEDGTLESVFCELTRTEQIEQGTRDFLQALSRTVNPPQ